ncbi:riboflavin synthase [Crenothrix sp.]|uniref:riboflavin synthase n=1 Tax=Crenothrix sp. TaxID=3100433 RepID=UPI00374DAFBB
MFTGIILAIGKIAQIEPNKGDYRLKIDTGSLSLDGCALGDSIAVNGVCLTAVELGQHYFWADVSNETLSRTTLANAIQGSRVNLELALTPSTRMGGHIVSGHVDGIGTIIDRKTDARSIRFKIKTPDDLAKYIAEKGSICINGISLTVNEVNGSMFGVNIVPHTLEKTTLNEATTGTSVNLEVDLLARYMERLLQNETTSKNSNNITEALLRRSGF